MDDRARMPRPDHPKHRELVAALLEVLVGEERARGEVRKALHRQAALLAELRSLGLPTTRVAHRLAFARGVPLSIGERLRLARRLRKRALRETRRPPILAASSGLPPLPTSPLDHRALTPGDEETNVAKLVKRTITEEYLDEDAPEAALEEEDDTDGQDDTEEDVDEEPAPKKRSSRR